MIINDALLNKLEKLSALKIPEERKETFKKELNEIVDFVKILDELDLKNICLSHLNEGNNKTGTPLREDEPCLNEDIIKEILKHAPKSYDGYFEVPKIIE